MKGARTGEGAVSLGSFWRIEMLLMKEGKLWEREERVLIYLSLDLFFL